MPTLESLKQAARRIKRDALALLLAYRDPRTPWYARAFAAFVVARTFSPIDLIPDFIPVLGYLDDLLLTPLYIRLAARLIPPAVMADARLAADKMEAEGKPVRWAYAVLVILLWGGLLFVLARALWGLIAAK